MFLPHPKGQPKVQDRDFGMVLEQGEMRASLFPSPDTRIIDDRQGRDTAIHKNVQGSMDWGSLRHDSQITEGANAQFLHCFLQEAWLGDGRTLQWDRAGLNWQLYVP